MDNGGTYGERKSWEDARVTVAEFLDDFYDDAEDNYNQAFSNLERRLQEYFNYEPRDTENGCDATPPPRPKTVYVVYNDGMEWARCANRVDAEAIVCSYDGEHRVWIEEEESEA